MSGKPLTCAITEKRPKVAALCFDHVLTGPSPGMPSNIRPPFMMSIGSEPEKKIEISFGHADGRPYSGGMTAHSGTLGYDIAHNIHELIAGIKRHGHRPIPYYESDASFDRDYSHGDHGVIAAALSNLSIVDEAVLSWEQVAEFRADEQARKDYRRLLHWLDDAMIGKPLEWVQDEIATRLEAYETALRKHGMRAILGVLKRVLSWDHLKKQAAVAALGDWLAAGWPAAAAAGAIGLATVAVEIGEMKLRKADVAEAHESIAFVHRLGGL
jgi:hypothetical protein